MSIRCKHCESRVPEWDAIYGACPECFEEHRQVTKGPEGEDDTAEYRGPWANCDVLGQEEW